MLGATIVEGHNKRIGFGMSWGNGVNGQGVTRTPFKMQRKNAQRGVVIHGKKNGIARTHRHIAITASQRNLGYIHVDGSGIINDYRIPNSIDITIFGNINFKILY